MSATRTLAKVGVGLAAAGVGAALGLAAERFTANRTLTEEDLGGGLTPYGSLRGRPRAVRSADGTRLHVEVDDLASFPLADGDTHADPRADADASHRQPTVVFTHGFALNLDAWHFQRAALRGHYRLVLWDQRGHGRSGPGPRGSSTIDVIGADLGSVLDAVVPDGPVVLVGHSMGGMTIMSLAAQRPELFTGRVLAVAFVGTSAGGLADVPWARNQVVSKVAHRLAPGAVSTLARRPELVTRTRRLGSDLEQLLVRRYSFASPVPASLVRFAADMIAATRIDVVADFLPTFDLHDAREALAALADTEVLVLGSAQDAMTPQDHSDELALLLPHAEYVVVQNAGHLVMLEHPEVVDQALFALVERGLARADAHQGRRGGRRRTVVGLSGARRRRRREDSA
ncbi:MAG: alpha/beta fold hydrolase [Actinomycetales bacterium]